MALKDLAKRLQFLDALVPLPFRVPFRYEAQMLAHGLEPEMALLPTLVAKDKPALDIGGNRGTYAFALSRLAPCVVSFEPVPDCARMLSAWARHVDNVRVEACGLGDREDTLTLHIPRVRRSLVTTRASFVRVDGPGLDVEVPMHKLDSFGFDSVGFVKIDVEGFEFATLAGGVETLRRCHPSLLIEIDAEAQSEADFARTFRFVEALGYRGHYLDRDRLIACSVEVYSKDPPSMNYVFLPDSQP